MTRHGTAKWRLTSLLVQLLQHFTNDLPYTLQSLDVFFGLVKVLGQSLDLQPERLELCLPFPRLDQLGPKALKRMVSLLVGSHGWAGVCGRTYWKFDWFRAVPGVLWLCGCSDNTPGCAVLGRMKSELG